MVFENIISQFTDELMELQAARRDRAYFERDPEGFSDVSDMQESQLPSEVQGVKRNDLL